MKHWRSLEEKDGELSALLRGQAPRAHAILVELDDAMTRRRFLELMGASIALAGIGACTRMPAQAIIPRLQEPEDAVPGKSLHFATVSCLGGYARGALARSQDGRPVKLEGNPTHPASLGATDVFMQASLLDLYDPERLKHVARLGVPATWDAWQAEIARLRPAWAKNGGEGLRILSGTITSPLLTAQLTRLLTVYPRARWYRYEPVNRDGARAGSIAGLGDDYLTVHHFERARAIVSLESDFLVGTPSALADARAFMAGRRARRGSTAMNRLHVVEAGPSLAGAIADHRLPLASSRIPAVATALARDLGIPLPGSGPELSPGTREWIRRAASDLRSCPGRGLVLAGPGQPPETHAWTHALNERLGNVGRTVTYIDPPEGRGPAQIDQIRELAREMAAGSVNQLLILGGNPSFDAPADLRFAEALAKVPLRMHLTSAPNETTDACQWHLPQAHPLEAWDDARAFDGTASIAQPLISPLYEGRAPSEVLAVLLGRPGARAYDLLREHWRAQPPFAGQTDFESSWRQALRDGVIPGTAYVPRTPRAQAPAIPSAAAGAGLEVRFAADPSVWDGRYASNAWLQELPRPLSKLVWDNAAWISPATASRLGVSNGDVLEIQRGPAAVRVPAWIMPGHADESVTLFLGYGRKRAGLVGSGVGVDVYPLRAAGSMALLSGARVIRTGTRSALVTSQHHHSMEGRDLIRSGLRQDFERDPSSVVPPRPKPATLFGPPPSQGPAWGMSIDLGACIGCNACVIACQAENNIPVVGKSECANHREMHWIRIDRYYEGGEANPVTHFQPVPCMHCETAPCEEVCPTEATVHNVEGLNQMIYNRCVGTRYCSNNCPYKVRRFNFFQYSDMETPVRRLGYNPDVTVRSRGVMEKCTYCVQRINTATITAKLGDRPIRDGEIRTACQQACPTEAIVFGNIRDPSDQVSRLKSEPHDYGLLEELGTLPRTTYLARIMNPLQAREPSHG